ncbi:SMK killer toxin resistance protein [Pyricularia oryzae]
MADFIKDLWESIFTPGPTPSLLIATNVSFAALQVVLFALLIATYSIHFVVLSGLCGGLWWAINWFAREVKEAQRLEQLEKQRQPPPALSSSDDETEVETTAPGPRPRKTPPAPAASTTQANPEDTKGELKHRVASTPLTGPSASAASSKSGVSTEDEWEKVSESEEKDQ